MSRWGNPNPDDERDYGPGGEVERLVLDLLAGDGDKASLTRIAISLDLDLRRLDKLLWRLYHEGKLRILTVAGNVKWRTRS